MRASIREKLAEKLALAFNASVIHTDIIQAKGHWAKTRYGAGVLRWEAFFTTDEGSHLHVGSYATMGDCVKYGITMTQLDKRNFEIDSKKPVDA